MTWYCTAQSLKNKCKKDVNCTALFRNTNYARQKRYPPMSTQVHHYDTRRLDQTLTTNHTKGWRSVPDAILLGHRRAHWWVPVRTPTVHQCPQSGKAVGGPNALQEEPKHEVFRQANYDNSSLTHPIDSCEKRLVFEERYTSRSVVKPSGNS